MKCLNLLVAAWFSISLFLLCCVVCTNNIKWMNLLVFCSFDEFLMDIKQSKRKNIRQERKKVGLVPPKHCFIHTLIMRDLMVMRKFIFKQKRSWWFVCTDLIDFHQCWLRLASRLNLGNNHLNWTLMAMDDYRKSARMWLEWYKDT